MITPTRTVCYAIPVNSKERFVVNSARVNGALIELQQRPMKLHYLPYSEIDRIIVREEPISIAASLLGSKNARQQWHGGVLPTECVKKFFLNADCLCEICAPNLWPRHHLFMRSLLEKDMVRYKKEPKS